MSMDKDGLVISFSKMAPAARIRVFDDSDAQRPNLTGDVSFIPHYSFWHTMDYMLRTYAVNEYELELLHKRVTTVAPKSLPAFPHDNENYPIHTTRRCIRLHDDILKSLDTKLLCLAYFMKISEFMPMVVQHYGPYYSYSATTDTGQHFESHVIFSELMDIGQMKAHIDETVETVHDNLDYLRAAFTDFEKQKRKSDRDRDVFCATFHDNREMDRKSAYDRIEYLFMREYGFPLGLFKTSPNISRTLAETRSNEDYAKSIRKLLLTPTSRIGYPGIQLNRNDKSLTLTEHVQRTLSRGCFGPIPKSGLNLADSTRCVTAAKQARKKTLAPR
jgi:hypothetical protein